MDGGGTIRKRAREGGITKEVSDGTKEGEKGGAAERVGKGRAVDSGLTLGKGKTERESAAVRRGRDVRRPGGWGGGGKGEEGVANDVRRAEDVDLVGICNDYAAATKQALKATEERIHADGEKLSA